MLEFVCVSEVEVFRNVPTHPYIIVFNGRN